MPVWLCAFTKYPSDPFQAYKAEIWIEIQTIEALKHSECKINQLVYSLLLSLVHIGMATYPSLKMVSPLVVSRALYHDISIPAISITLILLLYHSLFRSDGK